MRSRINRQGGWIGLIVLLLMVAIVGYVAQDALRKYGVVGDDGSPKESAGTPAESAQPKPGSAAERVEKLFFSAPPSQVLEKVREVETLMKRESEKRDGGY